MYLCGVCGANQIPWRRINCANCGDHKNCSLNDEATLEMFNEKVD